jgi:hypothetical protein
MNSESGWRRHARREDLIRLVLEFVTQIRLLPGILEISLIGSLSTSKHDPKDADLLIRIEDELDLTALARHGRRLKGAAQSIGHGADIFLISRSGEYLGRICQWKECAPGIRMSCDALHCGRRHFLHDDFRAVRLQRTVTNVPPLTLWPEVAVRATLSADLMEILVQPLATLLGQPGPTSHVDHPIQ